MPHKQKDNNECNSKCYYVDTVFFPYLCKRGFTGDYDTPMFQVQFLIN
jgi:hypothetical protein